MAEEASLTVRFEPDEPLVEFPADGVTVSVPLTPVGDRRYRLDGVPVFAESAGFGDVIEAEPGEGGRLRFVRVAEPGGWQTYCYFVSAGWIDGEWGRLLLRELEESGGHWKRVFGGILFVCLPPGLDLDTTLWASLG